MCPPVPSQPGPPPSERPPGGQPSPPGPAPSSREPLPADGLPLSTLVEAAVAELAAAGVDDAMLRVTTASGRATLAWFPLEGTHPLDLLLRFEAPDHWRALGVSCPGWAHDLDEAGRSLGRADAASVNITLLVDRSGAAAALLRTGSTARALPDRPEGVVADACRRALGLPTGPPPASTAGLWTLIWLDRIVEVAAGRGRQAGSPDWPGVAALHPVLALRPPVGAPGGPLADPAAAAAATAALARAWPWSRLRREPRVLDPPGLDVTPRLAAWMDDGMWARWLLSALPHVDDLRAAVAGLLPGPTAAAVDDAVRRSWPR